MQLEQSATASHILTYLPFLFEPSQTPDRAVTFSVPPFLPASKSTDLSPTLQKQSCLPLQVKATSTVIYMIKVALQPKEECQEVGQTNKTRATNVVFMSQVLACSVVESK